MSALQWLDGNPYKLQHKVDYFWDSEELLDALLSTGEVVDHLEEDKLNSFDLRQKGIVYHNLAHDL